MLNEPEPLELKLKKEQEEKRLSKEVKEQADAA